MTASGVIPALIQRHAGDAAFYWQQHDQSAHSPLVGLPQLLEFDRLLDAHLDGLRVAGLAGWDTALAELTRWRSAPEVFVCATLALESEARGPRLQAIWAVLQTEPERMLRGLIAALAWAPAELAMAWCTYWLKPEAPPALTVAAWRVRALHPHSQAHPLEAEFVAALPQALASPQPHVRAACCRVAAWAQPTALWPLLQDPQTQVRAEAAIALLGASANTPAKAAANAAERPGPAKLALTTQQHDQAAGVLWQACESLGRELSSLSGWYRSRAQHRLARWVCHLGLVAPLGHPAIAQLLGLLPPRLGLWFALHHGDGQYLPWVLEQMPNPEVSRLAAWVWSAFTGVDLQAQGLTLPPRGADQAPRPTDLQDPGLPEPDVTRIAALGQSLPPKVASLYGQPLDEALLRSNLWHAPQALRWIAAQRLARLGQAPLNTRWHARAQQDLLASLTPAPQAVAAA